MTRVLGKRDLASSCRQPYKRKSMLPKGLTCLVLAVNLDLPSHHLHAFPQGFWPKSDDDKVQFALFDHAFCLMLHHFVVGQMLSKQVSRKFCGQTMVVSRLSSTSSQYVCIFFCVGKD